MTLGFQKIHGMEARQEVTCPTSDFARELRQLN